MFRLSHPGLACNRRCFATQCHSLFLKQEVPQWHSLSAKGCYDDLPAGGVVQSVERVAHRDGPFPGLIG